VWQPCSLPAPALLYSVFNFLTCLQVLPERSYTEPSEAINLLIDAQGHMAPAGDSMATRQMSSALDSLAGVPPNSAATNSRAGEPVAELSCRGCCSWMPMG
jgi:hypothetical protein